MMHDDIFSLKKNESYDIFDPFFSKTHRKITKKIKGLIHCLCNRKYIKYNEIKNTLSPVAHETAIICYFFKQPPQAKAVL